MTSGLTPTASYSPSPSLTPGLTRAPSASCSPYTDFYTSEEVIICEGGLPVRRGEQLTLRGGVAEVIAWSGSRPVTQAGAPPSLVRAAGPSAAPAVAPLAPSAWPRQLLLGNGDANFTNTTNATDIISGGGAVTEWEIVETASQRRNGPLESMWFAVYWITFLLTYVVVPVVQEYVVAGAPRGWWWGVAQ